MLKANQKKFLLKAAKQFLEGCISYNEEYFVGPMKSEHLESATEGETEKALMIFESNIQAYRRNDVRFQGWHTMSVKVLCHYIQACGCNLEFSEYEQIKALADLYSENDSEKVAYIEKYTNMYNADKISYKEVNQRYADAMLKGWQYAKAHANEF